MDRIASKIGSHQNGLDEQLQVHIPMPGLTSIPSALQSNAEHRRTKNRLSQRKRREQLRKKKKTLENVGEEQLQNGVEIPAALPHADSQILGFPWTTTKSPSQDDGVDACEPIEPTNFPNTKFYNLSADDLLHQHRKPPSDFGSTNEICSIASTEGLFSPPDAHFSALHIDNILEIEYLNNFLFNSGQISPIEQTSASGSPDEGYSKAFKTERRRRSSTQSDSLASTESILDNEWDYTAFVEKQANFDKAIMAPTTRIAPEVHQCNKNHIREPISSDRTLLRLMASLPDNTKAWLDRKIKEDFPEASNMPVKEEIGALRDMRHLSSHLDNKKRAFVAGMVTYLMQDENTRLLWQRDRELVEKWDRWENMWLIPYSSLPSSSLERDGDSEDGLLGQKEDRNYQPYKRDAPWCKPWFWIIHLAILSLYATVFFVALDGRPHQSLSQSYIESLPQSPAIEGLEWRHVSFRAEDQIQEFGRFVGKPSPDIDKAWHDLLNAENIVIEEKYMRALGRENLGVRIPDGEGYIGTLNVYHEIHCLKRIHQYMYPDYYFADFTSEEHEINQHCIDFLLQSAMCHGDVGLMTFEWVDGYRIPLANSTSHQCINWAKLDKWTKERTVDMMKPGWLIHPKMGKLSSVYVGNATNAVVSQVLHIPKEKVTSSERR
ncbi:hypothetical protein TARUN_2407 [Trichoderma arundinaceum]|uniref:BZIP domain-containing protein n=1 Tax=Trichoderma arundinaceum TaxID=490622 RepID=A0A395NUL2_TRIAR|nr:hypothetical protein TARUN_2407 [Trichoderma arundinaceum]